MPLSVVCEKFPQGHCLRMAKICLQSHGELCPPVGSQIIWDTESAYPPGFQGLYTEDGGDVYRGKAYAHRVEWSTAVRR
jgi:hypothetical protein